MIEKQKLILDAYIKAINEIDDWFEYANESKKDREMIHGVLEKLTYRLVEIHRDNIRREEDYNETKKD